MGDVIVGVDPHTGRFGAVTRDYKAMLGFVRQRWPRHRWAIEGAHGVGRPLAQRLLADGERVVDVPAKLAARVRVFDTGHARKADATDAHAIAAAALRTPRLRELTHDEELVALRLLVDRRDELSAAGADREPVAPAAHRAHCRGRRQGPDRDQGQTAAGHGQAEIRGG